MATTAWHISLMPASQEIWNKVSRHVNTADVARNKPRLFRLGGCQTDDKLTIANFERGGLARIFYREFKGAKE